MKKISIIILLVLTGLTVFAQSVDLRRKIEVTGIAEQEVTPDIINVSISLKEYMDGKKKVTISQLEAQLEKSVAEAGIPKSDFTINNLSSYNNVTEKKKNPDFLASKQYLIRFHNLNKFNQLISKLDAKGIQSTNITGYEYSKTGELKNQLKLKALLQAKEKATFLLSGIGEKLGAPISIVDNDEGSFASPRPMMYMDRANAAVPESDIDVKTIKLSFQIHVIFEIAK